MSNSHLPGGNLPGARQWLLVFIASWVAVIIPAASSFPETLQEGVNREMEIGPLMGGCGGAYFLAEPGELVVTVEKRDRNNRQRHTELRALLVGPDRQVLHEEFIPDSGGKAGSGLGPSQRVTLSTEVERKGVYALNVTVSQDRYGYETVWGLGTNCEKYLIETARGHKDERHQEPIVLASPEKSIDVCFLPRRHAFDIEISGLSNDVSALAVYDGQNQLIEFLRVDGEGAAKHHFAEDPARGSRPWRIPFPSAQGVVQIDGLTRWDNNDRFPNVCCWTPNSNSWFPLLENRWLLTPNKVTVYGSPGQEKDYRFEVHNNTDIERSILLMVESCGETSLPAALESERVLVASKSSKSVSINYRVPSKGERAVYRIGATPLDCQDFSTYSTLNVKAGKSPVDEPLDIPVMLRPYEHENEQFGYMREYPLSNQVYFDLDNAPCQIVDGGIAKLTGGEWTVASLENAVHPVDCDIPRPVFETYGTKVAFDRENCYLLGRSGRHIFLLHSSDGCQSFSAHLISGKENVSRGFDIEQFSGNNVPDGPPAIVRYVLTSRDAERIWRRQHEVDLFIPRKVGSRIEIGDPIRLTGKCLGFSAHSGVPSSVVSRGSKVHVTWGEATDPEKEVPGVPTYVVTCDRETRELGAPVLVAYGAPANDCHNTPSITMDSRGYLHLLAGTHGRPFQYARSSAPNDADSGWTQPVPTGEQGNQTYIGLVCDREDTLHLVFRLWRSGDPFPHSTHGTLAYQRKRPGKPWEPPRILIVAPFSEYSVFYHRLTIDFQGRLFLSYCCWSTHWFYRNDRFGLKRSLLMSPDGGGRWELVQGEDFHRP